jgi:cytochrome c553
VPENAMTKMMVMQIKTLKDEEITALAHFYANQK